MFGTRINSLYINAMYIYGIIISSKLFRRKKEVRIRKAKSSSKIRGKKTAMGQLERLLPMVPP